jgi:hypothetical protein
MTDTAACDFDDNFFRTGTKKWEFAKLQRSVGSGKLESIRSLNAGHHASLPVPKAISGMGGA